ncbi:hypothetical protein PI125_g4562 [Phytophthora idaei]|nr:hypothetical protein PI125_g4562 [Phytophthora idaei]
MVGAAKQINCGGSKNCPQLLLKGPDDKREDKRAQ